MDGAPYGVSPGEALVGPRCIARASFTELGLGETVYSGSGFVLTSIALLINHLILLFEQVILFHHPVVCEPEKTWLSPLLEALVC